MALLKGEYPIDGNPLINFERRENSMALGDDGDLYVSPDHLSSQTQGLILISPSERVKLPHQHDYAELLHLRMSPNSENYDSRFSSED